MNRTVAGQLIRLEPTSRACAVMLRRWLRNLRSEAWEMKCRLEHGTSLDKAWAIYQLSAINALNRIERRFSSPGWPRSLPPCDAEIVARQLDELALDIFEYGNNLKNDRPHNYREELKRAIRCQVFAEAIMTFHGRRGAAKRKLRSSTLFRKVGILQKYRA